MFYSVEMGSVCLSCAISHLCYSSEIHWFIFTFQKRKKTWSSLWRCMVDTWVSSRVLCSSLSPSPGWTKSLWATPMPSASGRNRNHRAKVKVPIPTKPNAKTVNPNRARLRFTSTWHFHRAHEASDPIFKRSLSVGISLSLLSRFVNNMNRNDFPREKQCHSMSKKQSNNRWSEGSVLDLL